MKSASNSFKKKCFQIIQTHRKRASNRVNADTENKKEMQILGEGENTHQEKVSGIEKWLLSICLQAWTRFKRVIQHCRVQGQRRCHKHRSLGFELGQLEYLQTPIWSNLGQTFTLCGIFKQIEKFLKQIEKKSYFQLYQLIYVIF